VIFDETEGAHACAGERRQQRKKATAVNEVDAERDELNHYSKLDL
jgi:hypothetical protein